MKEIVFDKDQAIDALEDLINRIKANKVNSVVFAANLEDRALVGKFGGPVERAGLVSQLNYEINQDFRKIEHANMFADLLGGLSDD